MTNKYLYRGSSPSRVGGGTSAGGEYRHGMKCMDCGLVHCCEMRKPPFKRILYEKQAHPDNYTDEWFLSSLVTNGDLQSQNLGEIIRGTLAITQRITILVIFLLVFHVMHLPPSETEFLLRYKVQLLVFSMLLLIILGYCSVLYFNQVSCLRQPLPVVQFVLFSFTRLCLFGGGLLGLSPVLKTLTRSYSSDTIWFLTFVLCTVHVVMHEYSYLQNNAAELFLTHFQGTISLNAAIFSSILLASRLSSSIEVFAFIFFSFAIFVGFPFWAYYLRRFSIRGYIVSTWALVILAFFALQQASRLLSLVFGGVVFFVTFVCPVWLKWSQRYKAHLAGPWDYDTLGELQSENL